MYTFFADLGFIKEGMFPNFCAEHVQFVTDHIVDLIANSEL
jgi:hypothetical protein